jgi:hypothetical protein
LKAYLNGIQVGSSLAVTGSIDTVTAAITVGSKADGSEPFHGVIAHPEVLAETLDTDRLAADFANLALGPTTGETSVVLAADRLYRLMRPITWDDDAAGLPLSGVCEALALPTDPLEALLRGDATHEPWQLAVDAPDAPLWILPWLKILVGVEWPDPTSEALRTQILDRPAFRRGTTAAIVEAAKTTLTGTKTVVAVERSGGAWRLEIRTQPAETPDPAATVRAMLTQKPFGLVLLHNLTTSPAINDGTRTIDAAAGTLDTAVLADVT